MDDLVNLDTDLSDMLPISHVLDCPGSLLETFLRWFEWGTYSRASLNENILESMYGLILFATIARF